MKKIKTFLFAFVFASLAVSQPAAVAADNAVLFEETQAYATELFEMMLLLLDDYVGAELTPELLYEAAMRGISEELDLFSDYLSRDEYTRFIGNLSGHFEGIGVQIGSNPDELIYIHSVISNTPAEEAGVLKGDRIVSINGIDAFGMSQQQAADTIRAAPPEIVLEVLRGEDTVIFTMIKRHIVVNPVEVMYFDDILPFANNNNEGIRYVRLSSFDAESAFGFNRSLRQLTDEGVTDIVLDMRGNSGGYLDQVVAVARSILPEGPIFFDVDASGDMYAHYSVLKEPPFKQVVVLVDRFTASAAELLAAALQDAGIATVVGETTYGKGVIQTTVELMTGGAFRYTYAEYLRRSGEKIDRIGVIPDVYMQYPGELPAVIKTDENNCSDDILTLKNILEFTRLGLSDESSFYDDVTQARVVKLKGELGLQETGDLDAETIAMINEYLRTVYAERDFVLEMGYDILCGNMNARTGF